MVRFPALMSACVYVVRCGAQVEMSSLTGENEPVTMRVNPDDTSSVVHAHNIGFSSSLVISGEAIGVVTRCVTACWGLE